MTELVLGTVQFGLDYGINNTTGKPSKEEVFSIVNYALENGISEIDTAQVYGNSEKILGDIFKTVKNDKLLVHSKFIFENPAEMFELEAKVKKSLNVLNVKKLGYFYFHKYSDFLLFQKNGVNLPDFIQEKTLGLGLSIYDEEEFRLAIDSDNIQAIQIPFNIFDSSISKIKLIEEAKGRGKAVYCRSVFLQGLFFMDPLSLPAKLKPFELYIKKINEISKLYGISKMALALAFVKNFDTIDGVLIGIDKQQQLKENIEAWSNGLSKNVLEELQELVFENKSLLLPKNWN